MLRKKKAFSMVETTITIAVISSVLSILIPAFSRVMENSNKTSMTNAISSSYDAIKMVDLKDGTMEYGNGVVLAKNKDSKVVYYSIVSDGKLSETYSFVDKKRAGSIADYYFGVPKCQGSFQAGLNSGILTLYYDSGIVNNKSDQEEFAHTQAIHIVNGEKNNLDNAGNGGTIYDVANMKTSEGETTMSVKFISTGNAAPTSVSFTEGETNSDEVISALPTHNYVENRTVAATCTEEGYVESRCEDCNTTISRTLPALGHNYSNVSYDWDSNGGRCSATATCVNDPSHTISENGVIHSSIKSNPTCTTKGITSYTASFTESYEEELLFSTQVKDIQNISALNHIYGSPTYSWNGITSCSASTSCTRSGCRNVQTENGTISSSTKIAATCTSAGTRTYTATFLKTYNGSSLFSAQNKDKQDLPALGHDYTAATYAWTNGTACLGKVVCSRDSSHTISENGTISSTVKTVATCSNKGTTTYTASFTNTTYFSNQTKNIQDIPSLAHTPVIDPAVAATCTENGLTEGSHCSVCNTIIVSQETISTTGHNYTTTTAATCTEAGSKTCRDCGDVTTIAALDHALSYKSGSAASCTVGGRTSGYYCLRSGCDYDETTYISPSGHSTRISGAKKATCTTAGYTGDSVCDNCGETVSTGSVIPAGHSPVTDIGHSASCTSSGLSNGSHCSVCGEIIVAQTVINPTHDWDYIAGPFEGNTYFLKCLSCGAEATDVNGTIIEGDHSYA